MKRCMAVAPLVIVASTLVLAGCGNTNTTNDKNKQVEQEGNSTMTRTKTNSGLEYEIMTEGSGVSPEKGQKVTVHYTGWLDKNGQTADEFDSSVKRGQPFTFIIGIGHVIPGWDEGVMSMKVGEKRRLFIPASLGYGARGAGRLIPPHANLIFDVELLKIG